MANDLPTPESRSESYLAKAAGMDVTIPEKPESRLEQYLAAIAEGGGGGGGGSYTAGEGIDITNNEISVDTTTIQEKLTAGSGIDITDNTISAIGGGGPTVVQTTGTSTTDVMSQNAVTEALASVGGSAIKVLTADDYNYDIEDTGSFNTIALWLLDDGIYELPSSSSVSVTGAISGSNYNHFNSGIKYDQRYRIMIKNSYNFWFFKNTLSSSSFLRDFSPWFYCTIDPQGEIYTPTEKQLLTFDNIVNSLSSTNTASALSANQGKELNDKIGDLSTLTTTDKTSTVAAINELAQGGGGGDTVYSNKTTSNSNEGGAVYIGNLNSSQVEQSDPTSTDNYYKYFWALPGENASIPGNYSINILGRSEAYSISLGPGSIANTGYTIAIGPWANVYGSADYGVAIGTGSLSANPNSIALGRQAKTTRAGELNIGTGTQTNGYNGTSYRVIGGVHDGQTNHDCATVAQGNTLSTSAPTSATEGVLGQLWTDTTNMHTYQCTAISGSTYTWTQRW